MAKTGRHSAERQIMGGTNPASRRHPLARRVWKVLFRVSALVLIVCLAAIVGFTDALGYSWVYRVAVAAAFVCAASAAVLGKLRSEEAAGDAAWLLGNRDRAEKRPWDLDIDD